MSPSTQVLIPTVETEFADIPETQIRVSRVALGTWAMGGWMWAVLINANRLPLFRQLCIRASI